MEAYLLSLVNATKATITLTPLMHSNAICHAVEYCISTGTSGCLGVTSRKASQHTKFPVTQCSLPRRALQNAMLVALAVPGFWLRRSASNTMLVACTKYAGWRRSSPLAMPQFWLRRPPGYASILAAPPSASSTMLVYQSVPACGARSPRLCLNSGCAALNSFPLAMP